jgi:hypothetical protein
VAVPEVVAARAASAVWAKQAVTVTAAMARAAPLISLLRRARGSGLGNPGIVMSFRFLCFRDLGSRPAAVPGR